MNDAIILKNSVKCKKCNEVLISKSVDNKISCKCGNISISGGNAYLLREGLDYEELTEYFLND